MSEVENNKQQNIIQIKKLSIILDENLILKDIDFQLAKGEMAYIIGKTGSGKSTLLKTIFAEIKPNEGSVEVLGYDINKIKNKQIPLLRQKMGMVFQDFQLLTDRSVQDNLLFVMKATAWKKKTDMLERCNELLEIVNLKDRNHAMPHQLSGGEQQRVCIARALINNPELILADEPTGNLDPETSEEILSIFKEMNNKGISILIVTHNYPIIEKFPAKTYQCLKGKVSEFLSDEEINEITVG
jgi:cell division transport system ATP-binding protein